MEELKIIIEALSGAGVEVKTAFIIWVLCKHALPSLVALFLCGGLIIAGFKLGLSTLNSLSFRAKIEDIYGSLYYHSDQKHFLKKLKDLLKQEEIK